MWNWLTRGASTTRTTRTTLKLESLESREVPAILIQLDYSYDTGFFNNPEARAIMERVASELGNSINANLAAIVPSGVNTWSASFFNPATGAQVSLPNLTIGANTIKLFVGGRGLPGAEAGFGGFGGYSISGTQPWISTVQTRGSSGFSIWGGSITFDSTQNWHFGQTTDGLTSSKLDFYSVATHELGHVLGIGTAPQWKNYSQGGTFRGPNAMAVYGGAIPLSPDGAHWANGVQLGGRDVSLDPTIAYGTRVGWSALDAAALRDIGWAAANPEPPTPTFVPVPLGNTVPVAFTGGTNGLVSIYNVVNGVLSPTGQQLVPFANYQGTIRVAGGDFNGDGVQDYVFTVGAGPQSVVQILNGRDGTLMVGQTAIFPGFRGGLFVAAADIDKDGKAELIVSADAGAGPHIQTFRVVDGSLVLQSSFFAFDNPAYRGGARVAAGDLNRDGFADVIVTTGGQAEGRVAIYSGADLARGVATRLYGDFHPFAGLTAGINAAVGDMDGDGFGDLVITPDRGAPAHVKIWSGAQLATGGYIGNLPLMASFYGLAPDGHGARIAMRDMDGDGRAELVVASGNPLNLTARVFNYEQAVAGGGGAPFSFPIGNTNSHDGIYAGQQVDWLGQPADTATGSQAANDQPDPAPLEVGPGEATYTVSATPVTHQCNCGACRALADLANAVSEPDPFFSAIPVA